MAAAQIIKLASGMKLLAKELLQVTCAYESLYKVRKHACFKILYFDAEI